MGGGGGGVVVCGDLLESLRDTDAFLCVTAAHTVPVLPLGFAWTESALPGACIFTPCVSS